MSALQRRQQILDLVRRRGFVSIEALAQHFQKTPQTLRRDINQLCDQAMLERHHGGASLPSSAENVPYDSRQILHREAKRRIARSVAARVPNRASLFINLGTTTEEVATALLDHEHLRIITNNLNVVNTLSAKEDFEVIVAGGAVRTRDRGITGEATIDFIRQFKADYGVIGISGIDQDGTLLEFDYGEVRVSQAIIESSREVYMVADHTKFGRNAMVRLGSLAQIDVLFTDRAPPGVTRAAIEAAEVEIHISGENTERV